MNDILSCEEWRWVPFLKMMNPKLSPSQDSMEWAAAASLSLSAKGSYKALHRRKTFAGAMPVLRLVLISDQLIGYSRGGDRSADLATGTHSCNQVSTHISFIAHFKTVSYYCSVPNPGLPSGTFLVSTVG